MKVMKFMSPEAIFTRVDVEDKWALIRLMAEGIAKSPVAVNAGLSHETIVEALNTREKLSSTGVGGGFAFPHARFKGINSIAVGLAVLSKPLDYDSFDRKPVTVACMVIVPEDKPTLALKVMSQIARLFSNAELKNRIEGCVNGEEIFREIRHSDIDLDISIKAGDIMREPILTFTVDVPLRKATWMMARQRVNTVPVVDEGMRLLGEISSKRLFSLGMPDFFNQLKSISFICDFDPFEKYFFEEAHSKVGDLMTPDCCMLPEDATLMEVVFALTVKRYPKVYIVKDGKLVGVIDQTIVLERIINI